MISKYLPYLLLTGWLAWATQLSAQSNYTIGALTGLRMGWKWNDKSVWVAGWESRTHFAEQVQYIRSELSLASSHRLSNGHQYSLGYLWIFGEDIQLHRTFQQISFNRIRASYIAAHRFMVDGTFGPNTIPRYRARYRWTIVRSLGGLKVNDREFYLKVNHEIIHDFKEASYDLEFRWVPLLGYQWTKNNKIEGGLDYRINSWIRGFPAKQLFRSSLTWYRTF
ncbi:MAG: hypothetical protein ACO388_01715 [Saprospiraceae bacterium]